MPSFDSFWKKSGIESVDILSTWIEDTDVVSSFGNANVVKEAEELARQFSDFSEIELRG